MDLMREYPDKHFDLAIVDPPYGVDINMNMGRRKGEAKKHSSKNWDNSIPENSYFENLFRVSKNQIIWGGNYFPLDLTGAWIFWDKCVPDGVSFADGELAWSSFNGTLQKVVIPYSGFNGMDKNGKIHPTQKPVRLYTWFLTNYAKAGDLILDTHVGSASSLIACHQLGFNAVGCELDKEYFDMASRRLKEEQAQLSLFP
jgi:site-specific DNA-methyltransferase (adenine-specific)